MTVKINSIIALEVNVCDIAFGISDEVLLLVFLLFYYKAVMLASASPTFYDPNESRQTRRTEPRT